MTLFPTDDSKDTLKKDEELWSKTRDLVKSITNNSDNYEKKYMKIKFKTNDDLSLKKLLKLWNMIIVVRFDCHEGKKYYLEVLLDKCLCKLETLEYHRSRVV